MTKLGREQKLLPQQAQTPPTAGTGSSHRRHRLLPLHANVYLVHPAKGPGHPQPHALPAAPAGVFEDEPPKLHPLCSLAQLQAQFSFLLNPQINMCSYIFNRETVFIRVGISFTSFSPPIRRHASFTRETGRRTKRKGACELGPYPSQAGDKRAPLLSLHLSCTDGGPAASGFLSGGCICSPLPMPRKLPALQTCSLLGRTKTNPLLEIRKGEAPNPSLAF